MKIFKILILILFTKMSLADENKIFLEIPTGNAKLNLLLQNWMIYDEKNTQDKSNFRLRRAEIKLSGSVQNNSSWAIMFDPAKSLKTGSIVATNDNKVLQDFVLNYKFLDNFEINVGQFKIPTTAEGLISSSSLNFPERSMVARTYGDKRDLIFKINYKLDTFKTALAISHGNKPNTDDTNSQKDFFIKSEYSPFKNLTSGLFVQLVDTYLKKNKWGLSLFWDKEMDFFHSEIAREATSTTSGVNHSSGYVLDAGHGFSENVQGVLRYEEIIFSRTSDLTSNATTIGVNYFLKENNSKIQFASMFLNNLTASNGSYDISSTSISSSELYLLNFQMGF